MLNVWNNPPLTSYYAKKLSYHVKRFYFFNLRLSTLYICFLQLIPRLFKNSANGISLITEDIVNKQIIYDPFHEFQLNTLHFTVIKTAIKPRKRNFATILRNSNNWSWSIAISRLLTLPATNWSISLQNLMKEPRTLSSMAVFTPFDFSNKNHIRTFKFLA